MNTQISGALAAARAVSRSGARVTKGCSILERPVKPFHHFHYDILLIGPKERDRSAYVALQAEAEQALRERELVRYFDLLDDLERFRLEMKWEDEIDNLVTTVGENDILTNQFKGVSYTATWYVGLVDNAGFSAYAVGDTASSHAGWAESTAYSESTRQALTLGTASGGSIDNSASKATFSMNAGATLDGAFIISNSTKSGTTGILYSAGAFSGGDRVVLNGDTLQVQATLTV